MTCAEFLQELTDYLDGRIEAKVQSELEEHLQWCHNCFVVCDTTKMTIQIYRNQEVYDLPEELRDKLRSAVISKCKESKNQA